ncbi:hypothetical protein GGF32_000817 [Allomyces javanicus]|nr:hypothetical protein GGF32_000817 [Allomyces javanicus]
MASRYRRPHPTAPAADPSSGSSWPDIADFASQPRATQANSPDLPARPDILDLPDLPDFAAITAPPADLPALPDLGGDLSDLLDDRPGTPAAFARRYTLAPRVLRPALDFVDDNGHDLDVIPATPSSPLPACNDSHAAVPIDEEDVHATDPFDEDQHHGPTDKNVVTPASLTLAPAVSPARARVVSPARAQPAVLMAPPSPPAAISPLVSLPTRSSLLPMPLGLPEIPDPDLGRDDDDDDMQLDDTAEDAFDAVPPAPVATAPSAEPRAVPAPPPPPEDDEDEDEFGFLRSDRRVHRARLQYPHLLRATTTATANPTPLTSLPSTPARAPPATSAAAAPQPASDDDDDNDDFFTYRPTGKAARAQAAVARDVATQQRAGIAAAAAAKPATRRKRTAKAAPAAPTVTHFMCELIGADEEETAGARTASTARKVPRARAPRAAPPPKAAEVEKDVFDLSDEDELPALRPKVVGRRPRATAAAPAKPARGRGRGRKRTA